MPLSLMKEGEKARIIHVSGSEGTRKHLGALGFVPGCMVTVIGVSSGSMILAIHDSRIAINADLAMKIVVKAAKTEAS